MLRDADIAMYQAKDSGGDAVVVFDASMRQRVERPTRARERARATPSIAASCTWPTNPSSAASDGRVTSLEALLRWSHPVLGEVEPSVFVPIAEDTGLIVEIGAWVLDQACADLAALREQIAHSEPICAWR